MPFKDMRTISVRKKQFDRLSAFKSEDESWPEAAEKIADAAERGGLEPQEGGDS